MTDHRPTVYFDFIDPLSWLLSRELESLAPSEAPELHWHPVELRPPPLPLTTLEEPDIARRWEAAGPLLEASGLEVAPPRLVPWTRKAHELVHHADAAGSADRMRSLVFEAYMTGGKDIGRVDVLVDLAVEAGLDRTETKAVLDVDRYESDVAQARDRALAGGITTIPVVAAGDRTLEGFHNRTALRTFLGT